MDGLLWKPLLKWMIWGYPYFWKHPFGTTHFEPLTFFNPAFHGGVVCRLSLEPISLPKTSNNMTSKMALTNITSGSRDERGKCLGNLGLYHNGPRSILGGSSQDL